MAPVYPEIFASGVIINAFTPNNKVERETLVQLIQTFNVDVTLVMEYEKLESEIFQGLQKLE